MLSALKESIKSGKKRRSSNAKRESMSDLDSVSSAPVRSLSTSSLSSSSTSSASSASHESLPTPLESQDESLTPFVLVDTPATATVTAPDSLSIMGRTAVSHERSFTFSIAAKEETLQHNFDQFLYSKQSECFKCKILLVKQNLYPFSTFKIFKVQSLLKSTVKVYSAESAEQILTKVVPHLSPPHALVLISLDFKTMVILFLLHLPRKHHMI
jgi:hypothetical protein